jgi:hypothetical protein
MMFSFKFKLSDRTATPTALGVTVNRFTQGPANQTFRDGRHSRADSPRLWSSHLHQSKWSRVMTTTNLRDELDEQPA